MIELQTKSVRQGINKAYLKIHVNRGDLDLFKKRAAAYLYNLAEAKGTEEDEEHQKAYLRDFLKETFYEGEGRLVNTSKKIDLSIYSGKTTSSTVEVIVETKLPANKSEMMTKDNLNAKSFQQALHYYFEERESGNDDLKHVVITDYTEFFFFDAQEIERHFYSKKSLVKAFRDWQSDQKVSSGKSFMYGTFSDFIKKSDAILECVHVDLTNYEHQLKTPASDEDEKLIPLFKLFSPEHLAKKPFANDSNSLDDKFYKELLHILGLKEVKEKGNRLIQRLPKDERNRGSLIENTIEILRYDQHMNEVREAKVQYGESEDDQLFGVALELVITWMNRVLFLKLMEAQLLAYHNNDEKFKFLSFDSIDEYDELEKLFFRVLALRNDERPASVQERFSHIPYLNSSLFDATKLERKTIHISALDDKATLDLASRSILKKGANPPSGPLKTLDYLLRFLDAYNFSAESTGGIQTQDKTLINASVLGLIFEKINGYKDGSFFTPGFITEYMARETLRKAVVDKFVEAFPGLFPSPQTPLPQAEGLRGEGQSASNDDRGMSASLTAKKLPKSLVESARHLRKNQTEAEVLLWQLLRKRQLCDLKFRRQHSVEEGFILDFYCHEVKLAVELDGKYHQGEQQKMADAEREQFLKEIGVQVIRFTNEQVLENTEDVLQTIADTAFESSRDQTERDFENLWNGIKKHIGRDISITKANEIINSITICDPAVGSGHFLVSCLNELIAIKSDLKILCDRSGTFIPHLEVAVENDEMAVEYGGTFFEYSLNHEWKNGSVERKPAGSDVQKIQEALFHEKKYLIENCLFGVDINPNSVKISPLRLWIELLKHAYYTPHPNPLPEGEGMNQRKLRKGEGASYSELQVLPNIDINIKQGNSLVSRFGLDEDLSSIFKKSEHSLAEYKQAVKNYKETRDRTKKGELEQLIDDIQKEYSESLLNNKPINKKLSNARAKYNALVNQGDIFGKKASKKEIQAAEQKLEKLEEQKTEEEAGEFYREAFEWRFEFPEVLDNEGNFTGFDVVIGNPPYIRQEQLGELKPFLKTQFEVYAGTADLYAYFIEKGMNLLTENGRFHYIVANKWMRANYGQALRTWLQQRQITSIVDFGDLPVFEEATTYPCLLEIKKEKNPSVFTAMEVESLPVENFEVLKEETGFAVDARKLSGEGWSLVPLEVQNLLEKLKSTGTPLGEYVDGKIYRGVLTGYNKAFVINEETKEKLIAEDKSSAELIKPFLAGRDIKRYQVPKTDNYLILVKNGQTNEMRGEQEPWEWFSEEYPAVAEYLSQFEKQAKKRYDQGQYWWELRACDYYEKFEKPKIVIPAISNHANYSFDRDGKYSNDKTSIISKDDLNLLGVLNSKVADFIIALTSSTKRGGYFEYKPMYVSEIPIVETDILEQFVDQILTAKKENPDADTGKLEAEIDQLVYELYGLTDDEIAIVEESVE